MRAALGLAMLVAATAVLAQVPAAPPGPCADCGVVRSVRAIEKEAAPAPVDDTKPSGLVLRIEGGQAKVGSSTHIGKEEVRTTTRWEVIVRLDDGRFRVLMLDAQPTIREGDKVRVEEGRVILRD